MTPISSRTRHVPSNRCQTSQASQWKSHKRGKNVDTRQSDAKVNIPINDDGDLAKKVLRKSHAHSDISVHSSVSEGPESSSIPVCLLGGTLNDWRVYIIHYTAQFGGSVGTSVTTEGVYSFGKR